MVESSSACWRRCTPWVCRLRLGVGPLRRGRRKRRRVDVRYIADLPNPESIVEGMVVGTLFGDALLVALRRLAQANVSATVFDTDGKVSRREAE